MASLKKKGLFLAVNWGFFLFLLVFSGRRNSTGWVVSGSMAEFSFLCVGQLGGIWSISSLVLLAAVTLPGKLFRWGRREHLQIPVSE